jgi:hypothetical protein
MGRMLPRKNALTARPGGTRHQDKVSHLLVDLVQAAATPHGSCAAGHIEARITTRAPGHGDVVQGLVNSLQQEHNQAAVFPCRMQLIEGS